MSYEKTVWTKGDIITSEKLNKIENGIAGRALIINVDTEIDIEADTETSTLNKTWQEIYDTMKSGNMAVIVVEHEEGGQMVAQEADVIIYVGLDTGVIPNEYKVITGYNNFYKTNSADGYPVLTI